MKKRILFVTENLCCGGVEKCLIELLDAMDYEKYEVDLLLFNELGDLIKEVNPNVNIKYLIPECKYPNTIINHFYKSLKSRILRKIPQSINLFLGKNRYDIEVAYMHGYTTKMVSCIKDKSNKIAWIHTDVSKCDVAKAFKMERYLHKFNHIVCVSKGVKDSIDKLAPYLKEKSKVIYNIINSKKIKKMSTEVVDYQFKKNTIIGVGRFYEVKRFDLLIKAHKLLLADGVNNNLVLLGYGDAEKEYIELIKVLDVEESVDIIGYRQNPYPYIANSDVFALTSNHEGLPTVICEAMVLGKPIVSTRCAGAVELLDDGCNGILASCGNENEIKEALKEILTNKQLKNTLSENSINESKKFDKVQVIKNVEELFEYVSS